MLIHSDQQNFEKVRKSSKLFLLDFYATWCGPCQMLGREFEKVAKTNNAFDIVKIDAEENMQLAQAFGIQVFPTMFVVKDGKPVEKIEGYMPASAIEKLMKKYQ